MTVDFEPLKTVCPASGVVIETYFHHTEVPNEPDCFLTRYWNEREVPSVWPYFSISPFLQAAKTAEDAQAGHDKWVRHLNSEIAELAVLSKKAAEVFALDRVKHDDTDFDQWMAEHCPDHLVWKEGTFFPAVIAIFDQDQAFAFKMRWL